MLKRLPRLALTINCQLSTVNRFFVFLFFLLATSHYLLPADFVFAQNDIPSFIKVKDLQVGDRVFVKGGGTLKPEKIVEKRWVEEPVEVYNLSVDGDQTFFANDLAVHNKGFNAKAYFYWDANVNGQHDEGEAIVILSQGYVNWMEAQGVPAILGEADFHYIASYSYGGKDRSYREFFRPNNTSCGNWGGLKSIYGEAVAGACMDKNEMGHGASVAFPFGQNDRNSAFRIGGVNFKDYDTGAARPVYRYYSYCYGGICHMWMGFPRWSGNLPVIIHGDLKSELDWRNQEWGTIRDTQLYIQPAEFTVDYTGTYYFARFPPYPASHWKYRAGAAIYEKTGGNFTVRPYLCRGGDACCSADPPCYPWYNTAEAFYNNFVGSSEPICAARELHKSPSYCYLEKGKTYIMIAYGSGGGCYAGDCDYIWAWPFLQWAGARLETTVPNPPEPVAAIPLIKAAGEIKGRVWQETTAGNCNDGGEKGIQVNISILGPESNSLQSDSNGDYLFSALPGEYTITITMPGSNYKMSSTCQSSGGFNCTGNTCSKSITLDDGEEEVVDIPLWMFGSISGRVYFDPFPGACSTADSFSDNSKWQVICNGIVADESGSQFYCVDSTGSRNLRLGTYSLQASFSEPWLQSCAIGTSVTISTADPNSTNSRFFAAETKDPWFQIRGGDIHSDISGAIGNAIASQIPSTCTLLPDCQPYLLLSDEVSGYPGVLSRASGDVSLGEVSYPSDLSDNSDRRWRAESGTYDGLRADWQFYNYHLEKDISDWDGSGYPASGVWQTTSSSLTIGNWDVASGEKVVVLHDGNVNVNNNISVVQGGSLVVIASEAVNIDSDVDSLAGIFIGNDINTGTTGSEDDVALEVEGSLIGWGSVNLQRDLGGLDNALAPAEAVVWRPDMVVNANEALKRAQYNWQEVSP